MRKAPSSSTAKNGRSPTARLSQASRSGALGTEKQMFGKIEYRTVINVVATTLLALGAAVTPAAAKFDAYAGPKPIAVCVETDAWRMLLAYEPTRVVV